MGESKTSLLILCVDYKGTYRARIYSPPGMDEKDKIYYVMVLTLQYTYFGPFPNKYVVLSDAVTMEHLHDIEGPVTQRGGRMKYRNTLTTHF